MNVWLCRAGIANENGVCIVMYLVLLLELSPALFNRNSNT